MHVPSATRFCGSLVILGLAAGGAGCGGGGGGGDATLTLAPTTNLAMQGSGTGSFGLDVGQFITIPMVSGLRFAVFPFLDATDTIISARLRLRQVSVSGAPYTQHGNVVVDLVDFGLALEAGDQSPTVLAPAIGTLSSDATLGFKEVDVTAQVAAAAAANDFVVDFLLRFDALTLSPVVDYASFENEAGTLGTPDGPELIVTYR